MFQKMLSRPIDTAEHDLAHDLFIDLVLFVECDVVNNDDIQVVFRS